MLYETHSPVIIARTLSACRISKGHQWQMLWVREDIDIYISLQKPVYNGHSNVLKLVDNEYLLKKKPLASSLTATKWKVLKKIKKGLDICYIAETKQTWNTEYCHKYSDDRINHTVEYTFSAQPDGQLYRSDVELTGIQRSPGQARF